MSNTFSEDPHPTGVRTRAAMERAGTFDELTQLQAQMLDASVDCIKVIDAQGNLRMVNRPGCVALGIPPEERDFGMPWLERLPEEVRKAGRQALARALRGEPARFAGRSELPGQAPQYWDNLLTPMLDETGGITGVLCVSRNVTDQRVAELRLRQISETDELTGLPNRRTFNRLLRSAIARHRSRKRSLGLLMIDLDHFKSVNDTLGHPAGDHLLRVLARRLERIVGDQGVVTRLGGDEFAVVLEDIADDRPMRELARRITRQEERSITYAGQMINGGMSIGCALYPRDGSDACGLMKAADSALFDLKENGRGGVQMFDMRLQAEAEAKAHQRLRARQLIHTQSVVPHYQPKVDMRSGRVVGFEALLRSRDAQGRVSGGCDLGEAFADYGAAVGLAHCMQLQVMADLARWRGKGLALLPVAINAAPVEFLRDDFAERLLVRAMRFGIPPSLLEVEVTEQVLCERARNFVVRALAKLKRAGVRIALDDFGTGHSSLTHLHEYPIDCLKVDRSFIARMSEDRAVSAIVSAMGQLGPILGLDLVAEGVENADQKALLMACGYHVAQGFHYAPALPSTEVENILLRQRIEHVEPLARAS